MWKQKLLLGEVLSWVVEIRQGVLFRCLKEHSVNFEHQFENHNYHDMCVHET